MKGEGPTIATTALLAASLLGLTGCGPESGGDVTPDSTVPPDVPDGQVLVKNVSFTPMEVRATVGKPVIWRFDDGGLEHTVTADDGSFDSGRMASGTFERIFDAAGLVIDYHCNVHARMRGSIVVS